jgi:hypothetical protein
MLVANAIEAGGQQNSVAGWVSLITTPSGAFSPAIDTRRTDDTQRETVVLLRYGRWRFVDQDNATNNYGGAVSFRTGDARTRLQLGGTTRAGCSDCGSVMAGADMTIPLAHDRGASASGFSGGYDVAFDPGVGVMKPTGSRANGYALALSASLPMSTWFRVGGARLVPFVAPGAGYGRITSDNESDSGFRMMLGGGIVVADLAPELQLTVGVNKIFIDQGPTVFGIGIAFGR